MVADLRGPDGREPPVAARSSRTSLASTAGRSYAEKTRRTSSRGFAAGGTILISSHLRIKRSSNLRRGLASESIRWKAQATARLKAASETPQSFVSRLHYRRRCNLLHISRFQTNLGTRRLVSRLIPGAFMELTALWRCHDRGSRYSCYRTHPPNAVQTTMKSFPETTSGKKETNS